jgi:hypothetical protein
MSLLCCEALFLSYRHAHYFRRQSACTRNSRQTDGQLFRSDGATSAFLTDGWQHSQLAGLSTCGKHPSRDASSSLRLVFRLVTSSSGSVRYETSICGACPVFPPHPHPHPPPRHHHRAALSKDYQTARGGRGAGARVRFFRQIKH